jgi:hypothetical protein
MLALGASSDRTGERRWHAAGAILLGATGYLLVVLAGATRGSSLQRFCVVAAGA